MPVPVHAHPSPQCLSKVAVNDGIPLRLRANTLFFNLRQKLFTRKRKRADDLQRYGGSENCNKYGDSKGWHDLLYHLHLSRVSGPGSKKTACCGSCEVIRARNT